MFVVLTDGNFAKNPGFNNDSTLLHMAASLNSENVTVFFFSLGVNMTPDPLLELRSLSCMMNSTVTYVTLVDAQRNPHWAIRPYFDYQATLRTAANSSFWTETYDDFDGLGLVATVTYPVISEGILYGVAGIDVIVKSDDIFNSIKRRLFDANVGPNRLACQESQTNWSVPTKAVTCGQSQVNLTRCTKAVEPHDQPLCPQSVYLNEPPIKAYLKNLCCNNCAFEGSPKREMRGKFLAV
uniref:VWFA domain-containing protein n=1 Tax=Physcomitrium patens TaxID=3218 RepID=A0A7I4AZV4_PHYPA